MDIEVSRIKQKYTNRAIKKLINNIFKKLESYKNKLDKIAPTNNVGGTCNKCKKKCSNKCSCSNVNVILDPSLSIPTKSYEINDKNQNVYIELSNLHDYMYDMTNYYKLHDQISQKQMNDITNKLTHLSGIVDDWSRKLCDTPGSTSDKKLKNVNSVANTLNRLLGKPVSVNKMIDNNLTNTQDCVQQKSSTPQLVGGDDYETLKKQVELINKNNTFMNDKLTTLKDRMHKIIAENENLFKIRAKIEWIINRLEECTKMKDDEGAAKVATDLTELINKIKDFDNAKMVEALKDIEVLVSYLERTLLNDDSTSDKTFKSLGKINMDSLNTMIEKIAKSPQKTTESLQTTTSTSNTAQTILPSEQNKDEKHQSEKNQSEKNQGDINQGGGFLKRPTRTNNCKQKIGG